ncbi:C40 family peptidase [Cobetia sp. L2A1]|uniref:C40 family peptidase n=1 Tax=Cobetia sp. L2A1 TaxID=2686360 RepID=UPI00131E97CD|nr:NlpC/P60 family protein [Cobetia sp. L2A1]
MRHALLCCFLILPLGIAGCASNSSSPRDMAYYDVDLPELPKLKRYRQQAGNQQSAQDSQFASYSGPSIREVLMDEHDQWAGTPYRLGGTNTGGIDCSALMQHVFSDGFGIELPRTTSEQAKRGKRIDKSQLKPGDLVFFRPSRRYNHVGVYVGNGYFLHASTSRGVKLSRLDNVYWAQHYWQSRRPMPYEVMQMKLAMRSQ